MKYLTLITALLLLGCGRMEKLTPKYTPPPQSDAQYTETFIDLYGFIVSRDSAGNYEHTGDSLLWTGLALGLLPCDKYTQFIEVGLLQMLAKNGGHLVRHPIDLSESDDGKFGVYWGLKRYIHNCNTKVNWTALLQEHRTTVGANLHPMIDDILHDLGAKPALTDLTRGAVGDVVTGWAVTDVATQAAAYRLHLGFLVLDQIGGAGAKQKFCTAVKDANMELLNAYCGDPTDLAAFVTYFKHDEWEYKLQRSPVWESAPDGNGLSTPGLDLLMAEDFLAR